MGFLLIGDMVHKVMWPLHILVDSSLLPTVILNKNLIFCQCLGNMISLLRMKVVS